MSARTGAPAARALALGFHDPTNGTAAATAAASPTTGVAAVSKRRRPLFTPSCLLALSPIDTCVQKRNHSGRDRPAYAELNGQNGNEIGPGLQESARYMLAPSSNVLFAQF